MSSFYRRYEILLPRGYNHRRQGAWVAWVPARQVACRMRVAMWREINLLF